MGLENPIHLLVLAVIILLVFGSSQLPKIARSAGKHAREAKDGVTSFKQEFDHGLGGKQPAQRRRRHASFGESQEDRSGRREQDHEHPEEAAAHRVAATAASAARDRLKCRARSAVDAQGRAVDVRGIARGEEDHR